MTLLAVTIEGTIDVNDVIGIALLSVAVLMMIVGGWKSGA